MHRTVLKSPGTRTNTGFQSSGAGVSLVPAQLFLVPAQPCPGTAAGTRPGRIRCTSCSSRGTNKRHTSPCTSAPRARRQGAPVRRQAEEALRRRRTPAARHEDRQDVGRHAYRHLGREKTYTIGSADTISLAEARHRHQEARLPVTSGVDPVADRTRLLSETESVALAREKRQARTVGELLDEWLERKKTRIQEPPTPPVAVELG